MIEHPVYGLIEEGSRKAPSSVCNDGIRFCKPYSLDKLEDTFRIVVPPSSHKHQYEANVEDFEEEAIHIGPNVRTKFTKDSLVDKPSEKEVDTSHIPFDNVIDINKSDIQGVETTAKVLTSELMDILLSSHSPLAMAGEVAQSQVSAIFKDCFNIELEPNLDFENQLEFLSNLDTFCYMLTKQANIPEKIHDILIEKSVEKMILDWTQRTKDSKKRESLRSYRTSLENASTRFKDLTENGSNIATRGSFRS